MKPRVLDIIWNKLNAYDTEAGEAPEYLRIHPQDLMRMHREDLYNYSQVLSSGPSGEPTVFGIPIKMDAEVNQGDPQPAGLVQPSLYKRAA
jgi:hypothetical protein